MSVPIVSRREWGAKPWKGQPAPVPMSRKRHFLVHYHGGPVAQRVGTAVPRTVESIHLANGWSGPGYNFMVDAAGTVYEGRGWNLQGAHCPGRNTDGLGVYVAVGGDQAPTSQQLQALRDLYAEACELAGRKLEQCYHRKHYATECPGDQLRSWVDAGNLTEEAPVPQRPTEQPWTAGTILPGGRITTAYGVPGKWAAGHHTGDDWNVGDPGADYGWTLYAPKPGTVVHVGASPWGEAYGYVVQLQYPDGRRGQFSHLVEDSAKVRRGQRVEAGQAIGKLGSTGNVLPAGKAGSHCHYEERVAPFRYNLDARRPTYKEATVPTVDLAALQAAAKADPDRKQGGTTAGAADDVRVVEAALVKAGLLDPKLADGAYGTSTVAAYRKWQQLLGFTGDDADGLPGKTSLAELGKRYGFTLGKA